MSDSEEPIEPIDEGDDLFGDEEDEIDERQSPKERVLDDDDLASDPEGDSRPRHYDDADDGERVETVRRIMDATAYRHPTPKPSDGVLRALRVPKFIKFHPEEYQPKEYEPTEFDIENARSEHHIHVTRFSRDELTGFLDSNTNILRWSDGSLTISIGGEQYEVTKKPLAPAPGKPYLEVNDGHYYAAAAELSSNMLMTIGHVTEQYNIRPNKDVGDDALNLLADRMAKASKATNQDMIIRTTVDPELQKKKAELLEKERMKAQRKRENAQAKQDVGYGRSGRSGGLSIGALEGGRRDGGRKRGLPGAVRPKKRRPEYDSDDDLPQGVGRQEKYDMDDPFLAASDDEEEELASEDEDEDDLLDDEPEAPRRKRQRTVEPEDDEDASGDDVEPAAESSGRHRRRNVIDDEDEDD